MMFSLPSLAVCFLLIHQYVFTSSYAQNTTNSTSTAWPVQNNGLQTMVEWDHFSLIFNDERIYIFGGEMHTFRLPVPELWLDIMQKVKAMGMRSLSVYFHWGYHMPTPSDVDMETGARNLVRLFEMARDMGIFLTVRPGPYINAETNAGGFPLWITTGAYGTLRSNGGAYTAAWTPYMNAINKIIEPFQVTRNGTVLLYQIENELPNQWSNVSAKTPDTKHVDYMKRLEANVRDLGIDIPSIHNMPSTNGKSWSKDYDTVGAGGDVDIYGLDSYPSCWSCIPSDCSTSNPSFTLLDYWSHFQQVSPHQPPMIPEFQGGALNPWYGPAGGCGEKSGPEFMNFYLRDNVAQKITIMSLYMIYGGTNWGWLAAPFVPTSYGYGAAIDEDRSIGTKYYEMKSIGLFIRAAKELPGADRIGHGTSYSSNSNIYATELRNPDTNAAFYVARHASPSSTTTETFKLTVNTTLGVFQIPRMNSSVTINGTEAKILVTDFHLGNKTLIYSTAEVLTYSVLGGSPTLVLWVPTGQSGEFYVKDATSGFVASCDGCSGVGFYADTTGLMVTFQQKEGSSVLMLNNDLRVILMDRTAAYKLWVPALDNNPIVPVEKTALVLGPHLVRSANIEENLIALTGDYDTTTTLEVFTEGGVDHISWNGKPLEIRKTQYGSLKATIEGPVEFNVPTFGQWKMQDSLPERFLNYSDSGLAWVNANHTSTVSASKTATIPYLYSDEYGFHTGVRLWRGRFSGSADGVYINTQGGKAHGWSAFLNGVFIGSFFGSTSSTTGAQTLSFANSSILTNDTNTLLIMMDDSGHEEGGAAINVRGILNATLLGTNSSFTSWKVAGTAGGSTSTQIDTVRTYYNEGGLTAERLGWHLPGYDDSNWTISAPGAGYTGAGVKFYRTVLPILVPDGLDVAFAFNISSTKNPTSAPYRVLLYVNGYQYGRFNPYISSTSTFPVPPGILNYRGENVIAVAVWAQSMEGASVNVGLDVKYVIGSSLNVTFDSEYLRPGWEKVRLDYA